MEIISLSDVYKSFFSNGQKFNVLENVNLDIKIKDVVAVFGVSGSGKTTLMNIIGGFENVCSGKIVKRENLKIDYVTQYPHFINELSALDNLIFASFKNKNTNKIEEYLELFECDHLIKKKPFELSGGEKQRLSLIRALINNPDLLILDEPTASLDSQNKERVSKALNNIRKEKNLSIVLVTHDKEIVNYFDTKKLFELKDRQLNCIE